MHLYSRLSILQLSFADFCNSIDRLLVLPFFVFLLSFLKVPEKFFKIHVWLIMSRTGFRQAFPVERVQVVMLA